MIPGSGRSPGGGCGNPLQYSCLENPMDRGAWRDTVHGVGESDTQLKHLSPRAHTHTHTHTHTHKHTAPQSNVSPFHDTGCSSRTCWRSAAPTSALPPLPPGLTLLGGPLSHTPPAAHPVTVSLTPKARPCLEPARSSGLILHVPLIKLLQLLACLYLPTGSQRLPGFHLPFYFQPKIVSEVQQAHDNALINKCSVDNYDVRCVEELVNIKTWLITARCNSFYYCIDKKFTKTSK